MIKKNGFTLVELLAVIVLIAIITVIGAYSMAGIQKQVKEDIWNSEYELILNRAVTFGEDNKAYIIKKGGSITTSIQTLIDRKYLSTKAVDDTGKKVLVNETFEKEIETKRECYYINDWPIKITVENDVVSADILPPDKCK